MARSPDVAVIGAGIVGLAAADALARRGADVVVLGREAPGAGQSAGVARGFRHLHATREQIVAAVRARALWDTWSERAGERLVGKEGALRLGGEVQADAARLREAGVEAAVVETARERHPALAPDAGPLLWDPRGGAIRARRATEWLCRELGDRVCRGEALAVAPGHVETADGPLDCGHVVVCAGAGTERLWPRFTMRRAVHLRVTFACPGGGAPSPRRDAGSADARAASSGADTAPGTAASSWGAATWADRSGRFGALSYGVADGPGRFALGLAELDAQPGPLDPAADAVPAATELGAVRARLHAYAREAFPGLGAPVDEVVRLLTILPGPDEDAYVLERGDRTTVLAGHNLFKLAPLLGEEIAIGTNVTWCSA